MHPRPDAQQKIERGEIARIIERAIDLLAVAEGLAPERPDAAEKHAQAVVLDVEPVEPLAARGRRFPLVFPKSAQIEEMLERIVGLADALAKPLRQPGGVEDGAHVEEGVELLLRERRHVVEAERERLTLEAVLRGKFVRVYDLPLQFQQEGIALDRFVKEEREVEVRARRHLPAACAAKRDQGEGLRVAQRLLLRLGPLAGQRRENRRARGGDLPPIVQLRATDQRIIFRDQPSESRPRPGLANHCANPIFCGGDHAGNCDILVTCVTTRLPGARTVFAETRELPAGRSAVRSACSRAAAKRAWLIP